MAAWVQFSKFYTSMQKHKWPFGRSFQNFVFRCKKTNGRLGTVFKILHFAVKNELPFWYNCKILYFPVKKPLAVWVHAFETTLKVSYSVVKERMTVWVQQ